MCHAYIESVVALSDSACLSVRKESMRSKEAQ